MGCQGQLGRPCPSPGLLPSQFPPSRSLGHTFLSPSAIELPPTVLPWPALSLLLLIPGGAAEQAWLPMGSCMIPQCLLWGTVVPGHAAVSV